MSPLLLPLEAVAGVFVFMYISVFSFFFMSHRSDVNFVEVGCHCRTLCRGGKWLSFLWANYRSLVVGEMNDLCEFELLHTQLTWRGVFGGEDRSWESFGERRKTSWCFAFFFLIIAHLVFLLFCYTICVVAGPFQFRYQHANRKYVHCCIPCGIRNDHAGQRRHRYFGAFAHVFQTIFAMYLVTSGEKSSLF